MAPIATGTPDTLDDRLHRQALGRREDLVGGVDRCARRAVGRRDVGGAKHSCQHEQSEGRRARPGRDDDHGREHSGDDDWVQKEPEPQAEAAHQRAGEHGEEEDVDEVEHRRVPRTGTASGRRRYSAPLRG